MTGHSCGHRLYGTGVVGLYREQPSGQKCVAFNGLSLDIRTQMSCLHPSPCTYIYAFRMTKCATMTGYWFVGAISCPSRGRILCLRGFYIQPGAI